MSEATAHCRDHESDLLHQISPSRIQEELTWHPARDLRVVMDEVLRSGTDESYCFLNEGGLRSDLALFQGHFMPNSPEGRIMYAMKANPKTRILEVIAEEGVDGFDCASAGEIERVVGLDGVDSDKICFNNPVKRTSEVLRAYHLGVTYYTAQSRSGVRKVLEANELFERDNLELAVRLETQNPEAGINLSEKYGCSPEEALALLDHIRASGAHPGLAINTGSQNPNPDSFVRGIKLMQELANRHGGVSSINLGGGIPVNYGASDRYNPREYLDRITKAVEEVRADLFRHSKVEPRVIIEPGRALVADNVDLAIPILEIDENRRAGKKRLFMNDGIFTSFSDAPIHGWQYHFRVFTRDGRALSSALQPYTLFGRTCDSGDTLGGVFLPENVEEGDFLWVRNAGAYMDSQASNFNGFGQPHYVSYNTTRPRPRHISGTRLPRPPEIENLIA